MENYADEYHLDVLDDAFDDEPESIASDELPELMDMDTQTHNPHDE